ncbi:hypothetical protein FB567DRAFT_316683 [Paraphoma chrysanthemicola]|uniref:Myb-like domain-containing protein n=1 Tax=Paraphoma chrysanthemicola TaxID=798071 RepID=A0A8K0VZQ8_9PLEO|nr:hypothetical protein FB567DRAFT_316683 [Paraphoma chrysanthemicola]
MADPSGAPRRVSMAYILGFSKNPYKDPKPPLQPRPPRSSSLDQMMTAPGGIVEWAASDGRKGSLKGPGKTRSRADKSTEEAKDKVTHKAADDKKGEVGDEPGGNPHNFTDEEDKKLLSWKNENGNAAWKICGELLARPHFQCKDRYKELQGKEGGQNGGNAEATGSGTSNDQQQGKGNNKQAKSAGEGDGTNPHGFTEEQDTKLIDWRTRHSKQNWDDFAKEIGKLPKQCADRFREIKPEDWRPADAQNGGGKGDTKKNNKNKGKGNKNEDKLEATTAGTDAGGGNDLWGAFGGLGEDDNKEESGGTGNDNTGGDAGNNSSWDTNNAGNTAGASGINETSWGSGDWNNNGTGNGDTSGSNGNKSSWDTKNAGNTADTSADNATSWECGNWGGTSGGNGNTSGNNGNDGWNNGAEANNSGGGNGDWPATSGGNDNSGGNATSGGVNQWNTGNGGGDNSTDNAGKGGGNGWDAAATGGEFGEHKGWGDAGSKKSASKKSASNAGEGTGWGGTGGDGVNDAAATNWNADSSNQQNNDTGGGEQNAWGGGDTWGTAPAPAKTASKAGSKAHSHHSASHKSSHRHSSQNNTPTPVELEVKPDDVFSADDLRMVARILQQDYQMVWNRVSWRFKDKTGRTIAPAVFEKKITGRVEGKDGKEEKRERRRK